MTVEPRELARTLLARKRAERQRKVQLANEVRNALAAEVRQLGLSRRCWLIGSLAWGGFDETSDVDLVVEGLDAAEIVPLWDRLTEGVGRRIDLLRLEDLPEGFRLRVLSEGISPDVT